MGVCALLKVSLPASKGWAALAIPKRTSPGPFRFPVFHTCFGPAAVTRSGKGNEAARREDGC